MSTRQQLEVQLLVVLLLGTGASVWAQQADHNNRVVLELPTINFTRLYNEVPLIHLGRLYSRLFNNTKEKPLQTPSEPAPTSQGQPNGNAYAVLNPATESQRSGSNQVINVQVPNGQNGQQLYGGYGYGFGQGLGHGHGHGPGHGHGHGYGNGNGPGYGYSFPDYAQIYGSNNYNSIPGVQVLQQPNGFGFGASNYYNYVNLNNDRIRRGYRRRGYNLLNSEFNDGRGQLYADFAPYRQWLQTQSQQLNAQQQFGGAEAFDESLDYGEENGFDDGIDEGDDYGNGELDDYDLDAADYGDGDGDGDGDELWRQADTDSNTKSKPLKPSKPAKKLKSRRKKLSLAKQRTKRISY